MGNGNDDSKGYVFFTLFGRPHKKLLDFGRSLWLEVGLLYILVMRFVEIEFFVATPLRTTASILPLPTLNMLSTLWGALFPSSL